MIGFFSLIFEIWVNFVHQYNLIHWQLLISWFSQSIGDRDHNFGLGTVPS